MGSDLKCDILIVGGGCGGVAAALAACSLNRSVILTDEFPWLGGQLTSQMVPPDENAWIETHGCTKRYEFFREKVRNKYRQVLPLNTNAFANSFLNPGGGWVSRLCFEPRIGWQILLDMLQSSISCGHLRLIERSIPIAADIDGDTIRSVTFRNVETQAIHVVEAKFILDASELGDVLPLGKVEHVTGAESQAETGELHALSGPANPKMMQGITWCAALAHDPGSHRVIDRPADYAKWRELKPTNWPTKLFDFDIINPVTGDTRNLPLFGKNPSDTYNLFSYRQIRNPSIFQDGSEIDIDDDDVEEEGEIGAGIMEPLRLFGLEWETESPEAFLYGSTLTWPLQLKRPDPVTCVNWPQNDYYLKPIIGVPDYEKQLALAEARAQTMSLVYWLQTEAPRHDGGTGYPGLYLCPEIAGTDDGLAQAPYIRESRRIKSHFTITEAMVSPVANPGADRARAMPRSVGIGHYRMDLHPCTDGGPTIDLDALPFQIPLGAMIPVRVTNLIAAGKNIGTTHITNGCYRLHPVEWNIGESAALLAVFCLHKNVVPAQLLPSDELFEEFERLLHRQSITTTWPNDFKSPSER